MYSKIISQAPLTLVTLAEAKKQCRVTSTFDDDYITSLIPIASELAQAYTKRLLTAGVVSAVVESYKPVVQLPWGDATAITELKLDGSVSTSFTFEPITQKITVSTAYTNLTVTYPCGYAVLPSAVKHAVLLLISTMYNSRDDFVTGLTVTSLPLASTVLLDSVRFYVD